MKKHGLLRKLVLGTLALALVGGLVGALSFFAEAEERQELERPEPLFPKPCPEELKFLEQFGIKEAGPGEVVKGVGEYVPGEGFRLLINGDEVLVTKWEEPKHLVIDIRGRGVEPLRTTCPETGEEIIELHLPPDLLPQRAPLLERISHAEKPNSKPQEAAIAGVMPISGTLLPQTAQGFGPWFYSAGDWVSFHRVQWNPGDSTIALGLICMDTNIFKGRLYTGGFVWFSPHSTWRTGLFAPAIINLGPGTIGYTGWLNF